MQLKAIILYFRIGFFLSSMRQIHVHHTVAHLLSLSSVIYLQLLWKDSQKIRTGATTCGWIVEVSSAFLAPLLAYQSRAIVSSRLDIYMAIAGAPTQPAGVCAPRPELKPPHYHGGPWRAAGDRGGGVRGVRRVRCG